MLEQVWLAIFGEQAITKGIKPILAERKAERRPFFTEIPEHANTANADGMLADAESTQ